MNGKFKNLIFLSLSLCLASTKVFAANEKLYECDNKGVCTEITGVSAEGKKNFGIGLASSPRGKIGSDAGFGQVNSNLSNCDSEGFCAELSEAINVNISDSDGIFGQNDNNASGSPQQSISGTYTMRNTIEISCAYHKNYTLGSGITIRIDNCHLDADNNVQKLDAKVCHKTLAEEGCQASDDSHWSAPQTFNRTSLPYINGTSHNLDPKVQATVMCQPMKRNCRMDVQTQVELSGSPSELAAATVNKRNDEDSYFTGNQLSNRISENPTYQSTQEEVGNEMVDCAKNNLVGLADEGYLLSCDGETRVDLATTCVEVATCIREESMNITFTQECTSEVPINRQYCEITMPYGSCEVFLEAHEQVCDTTTPYGNCVKDLNNVIQTCDVHVPNGNCTNELEIDDKACIYSVPNGSCNVDLIADRTKCTGSIPQGECDAEVDTFVKSCDEDVSELTNCFMEVETTEAECTATAVYDTQKCENTRTARTQSCTDTFAAQTVTTSAWNGGACPLPSTPPSDALVDGDAMDLALHFLDMHNNGTETITIRGRTFSIITNTTNAQRETGTGDDDRYYWGKLVAYSCGGGDNVRVDFWDFYYMQHHSAWSVTTNPRVSIVQYAGSSSFSLADILESEKVQIGTFNVIRGQHGYFDSRGTFPFAVKRYNCSSIDNCKLRAIVDKTYKEVWTVDTRFTFDVTRIGGVLFDMNRNMAPGNGTRLTRTNDCNAFTGGERLTNTIIGSNSCWSNMLIDGSSCTCSGTGLPRDGSVNVCQNPPSEGGGGGGGGGGEPPPDTIQQ